MALVHDDDLALLDLDVLDEGTVGGCYNLVRLCQCLTLQSLVTRDPPARYGIKSPPAPQAESS
jgi:hypothetical protein